VVKFGDYLRELKPPLSVNVIRMNPLRGFSSVVIDPSVIFSSLDSFFGGFGKGTLGALSPGRMFTPMESRIINMILDAAFRTLRDAWSPILPLDFELVSQEINPQFAQIADENDLVILSRFETETPTQNMGFIDIVHPYVSLKPVRELLRSRLQAGDGNEESDKVWRDELEAAVGGSSLDSRVVLGQIHTTFRAVETMQAGDILHFKKPEFATLQPNGIPAFEVHIGTVGAQVAVQIERAIAPGGK
jgi:flagellar motor switch protein FliM